MLIGISGKFNSGKDTLTNGILEFYEKQNIETLHLKFADKLKQVCSIISGTDLEDGYTEKGKEKFIESLNLTLGRFQQLLGTNLRSIHPDIWVIPVIDQYLKNCNKVCVVSDVRFKNEADSIKQNGGILIRINRNIKVNNGRDPLHISETDLDDYSGFDLVIDNNGTIEELIRKAIDFLESL